MKEDATSRETITVAISETIGTAILVFIGCTGCIGSLGINPTVLQIALTSGLGVMIAVQVRISAKFGCYARALDTLTLRNLSLCMFFDVDVLRRCFFFCINWYLLYFVVSYIHSRRRFDYLYCL